MVQLQGTATGYSYSVQLQDVATGYSYMGTG
uniref:Uncharacterized protein n=1 Tax=Anguilla anguilla TaxID=7936 RepID=A0A0E9R7Z0_ANGAN